MTTPRILRLIAGMLASVALALGPAGPVSAAPDPTQAQVAAYMAAHPGGQQISATEIAYGGGRFVVTVTRPAGTLAAPDCPSGWYCFYDRTNFNYPRGKLSDCGWQDLGWWGWRNRTESVHYNMASGSALFMNEAGATDTILFTVSPTRRTIVDVGTHRNKADYVYRYCYP
jgi:hypothetical protein